MKIQCPNCQTEFSLSDRDIARALAAKGGAAGKGAAKARTSEQARAAALARWRAAAAREQSKRR